MLAPVGKGDNPNTVEIGALPAQRVFAEAEVLAELGDVIMFPHYQLQAFLRSEVIRQIFGVGFIVLAVDGHGIGYRQRCSGLEHTVLGSDIAGFYGGHINE